MPERPQYLLDRDAKRRADVQFTQRDDVRDFARSGPGRNYFAIENLQSQAPSFATGDPRIDELKKRRRTWNRYQKYPAGEMLGKTPQQMQNEYMGLSRDLRQTAKPAYNKMYPITGNFMDVAEKGGIWGAMLSNFFGGKGKEIKKSIESVGDRIGGGITNFIDDEKEKEEYAAKTFPFYSTDIHPGLPEEPSLIDEESALTREEQIEKLLVDPGIRTDADFLLGLDEDKGQIEDDYYGKSEEGEMVFADEPKDDLFVADTTEDIGPLPFDEGREDFIRRQNEYVSPIPAPLGTPDPQGDFYFDAENWDDTRSDMYIPPLDADQGAFTSLSPFDDSYREKGIMNAMRAPYAPRKDYTMPFPPRGPHDPFDPDQQYFENRDEYDAWLRRQRLGP